MRTFITLFLWATIALGALFANAAHSDPTLSVFCGDMTGGVCSEPYFIAEGLKPGTNYVIEGVGPTGEVFDCFFTASDVSFDSGPLRNSFHESPWIFELRAIGHKGNPQHKLLATYPLTF